MLGRKLLRLNRPGCLLGLAFLLPVATYCILVVAESTELDIDTSSGRLRGQRWLGPVVIASHVRETRFSRLAATLHFPRQPEQWHCVQTSSFHQPTSPYYVFHLVPFYLDYFMLECEVHEVSEKEKERMATKIFEALRRERLPELAKLAIESCDEAGKKVKQKGPGTD